MDVVIKRLYLANGNLTQPLDKNDENIAVDANTAIQLATLNVGDWCYLTLIEGNKLEVIKITKFPSWYWVDRGQDSTSQFSFSTQAKIVYLLTAQEIEDAVNGTPLNIYPNGYGALEVNTGINSWQISYTELSIQTLGGISWMNPDGYEIIITDNNGMFGCCDGNLTGAPYAGGTFFYLTSQLYAYYGLEWISPTPHDLNGNAIPPIDSTQDGWWLLQQPYSTDQFINPSVSVTGFNLFGGIITYHNYIDSYINPVFFILSLNMYGGMVYVSPYIDTYMGINSYLLVMNMFGNSVNYNSKYIDVYMNQSVSLTNLSLQ